MLRIAGLKKSKNKLAGRYEYRGCFIQKTFHNGGWHVHCAEAGVQISKGIKGRTLRGITQAIDQELSQAARALGYF